MNNNSELHNQVKQTKNAQELMELCRANGLELTTESADRVVSKLRMSGEVVMDELMRCAGGSTTEPRSILMDPVLPVPSKPIR
ncbi:MAG: hypothetical protein U0L09_07720 [Christensenellales bacterium]|nr:hypothetical protein [Christensenellales bacterium]